MIEYCPICGNEIVIPNTINPDDEFVCESCGTNYNVGIVETGKAFKLILIKTDGHEVKPEQEK